MKTIKGPRAGSRAHTALRHLEACKGVSSLAALCQVTAWLGTPRAFDSEILDALVREGFVRRAPSADVLITLHGMLFLNPPAPQEPEPVVLVAGRYVAPERPLSAKNMPRLASMRPGALEYRDFPSLLGEQRLPHGQKAEA